MRFFQKAPDGGKYSGVDGYFLIEIKWLFTIVLLHFSVGTRDAYHSHAFNAITYWWRGRVMEYHRGGKSANFYYAGDFKYTSRSTFHKVEALEETWAISFRGPWANTWQEDRSGKTVTLKHGREEVSSGRGLWPIERAKTSIAVTSLMGYSVWECACGYVIYDSEADFQYPIYEGVREMSKDVKCM